MTGDIITLLYFKNFVSTSFFLLNFLGFKDRMMVAISSSDAGEKKKECLTRSRLLQNEDGLLVGTTDARVACSFVFTRPFSN